MVRVTDDGSSRYHKISGKRSSDSAVDGVADRRGIELEVPAIRCSLAAPGVLELLRADTRWNYF